MSNRLNDLRKKQGETHDKMEALLKKASDEKREMDEIEVQAFDELEKEFKAGAEAIKREEAVVAMKAALAKPANTEVTEPAAKVFAAPKVRYGKLKAFKGQTAEEDAYVSGMFLRAAIFNEEKAFHWCKEHGIQIVKAQAETVGGSGGFLVPVQFNQAIIDLREEYGVFRTECQLIPMGSDTMTMPRRAGGLTAYFPGENGQITESQKSWGQVQLAAKKLAVLSRMSTELAEDAIISIADDLASEMAYAFAQTEDSCGWNGDGTSAYGGITGATVKIIDGTHTKSAVNAASGHDTFAEVDATDLANLMAALPKYAEKTAKFYCSQPAWALVFQRLLAAGGGNAISDLNGRPQRSYLGYPVVIDQSLPTSTGTLVNKAMIFFGDLSKAATMGERRGITVKTSNDRYFEFDQIGVQATERVDINVHDLGDTNTAGPLAALIGA